MCVVFFLYLSLSVEARAQNLYIGTLFAYPAVQAVYMTPAPGICAAVSVGEASVNDLVVKGSEDSVKDKKSASGKPGRWVLSVHCAARGTWAVPIQVYFLGK